MQLLQPGEVEIKEETKIVAAIVGAEMKDIKVEHTFIDDDAKTNEKTEPVAPVVEQKKKKSKIML